MALEIDCPPPPQGDPVDREAKVRVHSPHEAAIAADKLGGLPVTVGGHPVHNLRDLVLAVEGKGEVLLTKIISS